MIPRRHLTSVNRRKYGIAIVSDRIGEEFETAAGRQCRRILRCFPQRRRAPARPGRPRPRAHPRPREPRREGGRRKAAALRSRPGGRRGATCAATAQGKAMSLKHYSGRSAPTATPRSPAQEAPECRLPRGSPVRLLSGRRSTPPAPAGPRRRRRAEAARPAPATLDSSWLVPRPWPQQATGRQSRPWLEVCNLRSWTESNQVVSPGQPSVKAPQAGGSQHLQVP
mmetsp:Transcript_108445/g.337982  ORF Transcript_108445/g.337982 Transcript_108445/m.337982 type:complete len:225 (-) Transcript_108445:92-766(-)